MLKMLMKRKVCRLPKDAANRFIKKDIEFAREFIQNHKNDPYALNAVDHHGNTPLILACIEGHGKIVELLLKNSHVDVNVVNKNGETALIAAALMAWPHIAKILLKHKAIDVNHSDPSGDTALHIAIDIEDRHFVEHLLRDKRTNVNLKNHKGQTALHAATLTYNENRNQYYASQFKSSVWRDGIDEARKVVALVCSHHDMDKNIRDNNGKTAEDYDEYHIITPAAPAKPKPKTYAVNADEYQQFMMWKQEKRAASREEQHPTNVNTMRFLT